MSCCYDTYSQNRKGHEAIDWWVLPTTNVPENFRGVMWLPGNGDPSLLSFNTSFYDAAKRRLLFQIYGVDSWASIQRASLTACARGSYVLYIREDERMAQIKTTFDWPCLPCESCVCVANFTMTQHDEDPHLWDRKSVICQACFGELLSKTYVLTRVIDHEGEKTKHYAAMIQAPETERLYTREPCPYYYGTDVAYYNRKKDEATAVATAVAPAPAPSDTFAPNKVVPAMER